METLLTILNLITELSATMQTSLANILKKTLLKLYFFIRRGQNQVILILSGALLDCLFDKPETR